MPVGEEWPWHALLFPLLRLSLLHHTLSPLPLEVAQDVLWIEYVSFSSDFILGDSEAYAGLVLGRHLFLYCRQLFSEVEKVGWFPDLARRLNFTESLKVAAPRRHKALIGLLLFVLVQNVSSSRLSCRSKALS